MGGGLDPIPSNNFVDVVHYVLCKFAAMRPVPVFGFAFKKGLRDAHVHTRVQQELRGWFQSGRGVQKGCTWVVAGE